MSFKVFGDICDNPLPQTAHNLVDIRNQAITWPQYPGSHTLPHLWPWTTKLLIRVNWFKLRFIHNPKAFGLLGYDNIWLIYNYLYILNLRVQNNQNIKKIAFIIVQMKFLAMHITNPKLSFDIYDRTFTKYLLGTWSLLNILMIFGIKEKSIILVHIVGY